MVEHPAVYIVANKKNGTIYTGVTSNLIKRIYEHKEAAIVGFTKRYGCKILVFYELHHTMESAISREKQIKSYSRQTKLRLIERNNPEWRDLYSELL